jgi:hypothetical protein
VVTIDRWYIFRPDKTGYYTFLIHEPFHGFFIVRADDGFLTSKDAWARVDGNSRIFQYNWKPESWYTVLNIGDDNIDIDNRIDTLFFRVTTGLLGGGDLAWLRVTQRLTCHANGFGSYAELNFSEGVANYLPAPFILILGP